MSSAKETIDELSENLTISRRFQLGDVEIELDSGQVKGPGGTAQIEPKVMAVLVHLAQARGALVTREDLMANVWENTVVTDVALSRCIYQLRKNLVEVTGTDSAPIETHPKRGYRLVWNVSSLPIGHASAIKTTNVIFSILVLLLGTVFIVLFMHEPDSSVAPLIPSVIQEPVRVAVIPLLDLSPDATQRVFTAGVTKEIMHEIAAIPNVIVIGRDSVFDESRRKSSEMDLAKALNADFLLSGSVTVIGSTRRILMELRTVPEGELFWSHSYIVEPNVPFVLLRQVAQSTASLLNFSIESIEGRFSTRHLKSFEAYLDALNTEHLETKRQLLLRAVEIDSQFAAAWNALAEIEAYAFWNGDSTIESAWARARPLINKALEIDPTLPSAYVTLGRFERSLGNPVNAISSFEHALKLDPGNSSASANLGLSLRWSGQYEEALAVHEVAAEMDPLSPAVQVRLGTSYWFMGNHQKAAHHYQRAIDLNPQYPESYDSWAGMLGAAMGRFDESLNMMLRKLETEKQPTVRTIAVIANLASILGLNDVATSYWAHATALNPDYLRVHISLARYHLATGDDDAARNAAHTILNLFPIETTAQLVLAILDLENGAVDDFVKRIRVAYPTYFDKDPMLDREHLDIALLVALAFQVSDKEDAKLALLDAVQAEIGEPQARQYLWLAALHAMKGELELSMQYLHMSPPGRVRGWAALLMRDPRFTALSQSTSFRTFVKDHLSELREQSTGIDFRSIPKLTKRVL